jgi:hypothetical protein
MVHDGGSVATPTFAPITSVAEQYGGTAELPAAQQGEISFCAYNTGIGWRNIIEKMHMTATLTKWYEEHGRHEIFAGNKPVPLSSTEHSLKLNAEAVAAGAQTDLDKLGIAKNAREEKLRARKIELRFNTEFRP